MRPANRKKRQITSGLLCAATAASLTLGACATSTDGATPTGSPNGTATTPAPTSPTSPTSPPSCPNDEGGRCLGPLVASRSYTTVVFTPAITYSVPIAGWMNFEDTPGNFLLVPPGSDLPGVNAGTSDYIGVYTSVAPETLSDPIGCQTTIVPGISTPAAMVSWASRQPSLTVSPAAPVTVGGLTGLVVDVAARPGRKLPTCRVGLVTYHVGVVLGGLPPSSLDHGVIAGMSLRLYLLAYRNGILAIELDDITAAPGNLDSLSAVAQGLRFAP